MISTPFILSIIMFNTIRAHTAKLLFRPKNCLNHGFTRIIGLHGLSKRREIQSLSTPPAPRKRGESGVFPTFESESHSSIVLWWLGFSSSAFNPTYGLRLVGNADLRSLRTPYGFCCSRLFLNPDLSESIRTPIRAICVICLIRDSDNFRSLLQNHHPPRRRKITCC